MSSKRLNHDQSSIIAVTPNLRMKISPLIISGTTIAKLRLISMINNPRKAIAKRREGKI